MHDLEIAREELHYVGDIIWTNSSSWKEIEDNPETRVDEMWNSGFLHDVWLEQNGHTSNEGNEVPLPHWTCQS